MRAFRYWLARRTDGEWWLAGLLIAAVAVLIWVWSAWKRDLEPMVTIYGTVADWVAAVGTIGAILVALTRSGRALQSADVPKRKG